MDTATDGGRAAIADPVRAQACVPCRCSQSPFELSTLNSTSLPSAVPYATKLRPGSSSAWKQQ